MFRTPCLLLGLCLAFAPLVTSSRTGDPSPTDLSVARGGNPNLGKDSLRCDKVSGQYAGCTIVNGNCQQCQKVNENGTLSGAMVDITATDAPKGDTGYQIGTGHQDCGELYMGLCVADSSSPTGFACVLAALNKRCNDNYSTVVPQNSP